MGIGGPQACFPPRRALVSSGCSAANIPTSGSIERDGEPSLELAFAMGRRAGVAALR